MTATLFDMPVGPVAESSLSAPSGRGSTTLEERLQTAWRGLRAAGAAECPVCGGQLILGAGGGECEGCGGRLT